MESIVIRAEELTVAMDALAQYLENAATDDDGEPIETPEYLAAARLLRRIEAIVASGAES